MLKLKSQWLALVSGAALLAGPVFAQDSGPLLDLLVRKGLVSDQEAEELRAELAREAHAGVVSSVSGGKSTTNLSISARIQAQYAGLSTDIDGAAADPASTSHFFLRRVYLGLKANLVKDWSANLNYDFAGSTFDAAFVQWKRSDAFVLDLGFRKAPIGLDEWYTSSSNLRAIERSPVTRYFVESNNGRRLGAGSYRTGVFLGGKADNGVFYNVAVTNPERDESSLGVAGIGNNTNNNLAYWANVGYKGKAGEATYTLGASAGFLPDQGGTVVGAGDDLTVYNVFAEIARGGFNLQAEYYGSQNENGVSPTVDASSWGFSIMPSLKLTDPFELVARYSYVDSDGRGVNLSDGIRSAPGGGTMDKMEEWFLGFNYYISGNDVKLQGGYLYGKSKDTPAGGTAKAETQGLRSMVQVAF